MKTKCLFWCVKLCSPTNNFYAYLCYDPVPKQSVILCQKHSIFSVQFLFEITRNFQDGIRACPDSLKVSKKLKEGFFAAAASPSE